MTWVKVCGLTTHEDVEAAVRSGADAVGFVNVAQSPRFVELPAIAKLAADVPVHKVVLTADMAPDPALEALHATGANGIQPYGKHQMETAAAAHAAGYLVLFPHRAGRHYDLGSGIPLIDTPSASSLGGTGHSFDWDLVTDLGVRFVLAGGLGPENVAAAVSEVRPWGVDASSRLERSPGRKDHSMVADFIAKAKET